MKTDEMVKHIETLIAKAAEAGGPEQAMKFAQAALNVANAVLGISNLKKQ